MRRFALFQTSLLALFFSFLFQSASAQLPGPGNCIGFNPGNNHIAVPNAASLSLGTAFTVEGWFLPLNPSSGPAVLIGKRNAASGAGFALTLDAGGYLDFVVGTGSVNAAISSPAPVNTFLWNHFAATCDGAAMRLYINGVEQASQAFSSAPGSNVDSLFLGANFRGEMDEVRIWNAAVSEPVLRAYLCQKLNAAHPHAANLAAHWNFDTGAGTTLVDRTASGNDGQLVGSLMWGPSAAPFGDASVYDYGSASFLEIEGPPGDTFRIDNWSNNPLGVHVYAVGQAPRVDTLQGPAMHYSQLDTSHYFGYFFAIGPGGYPQANVHYAYADNPFYNGHAECDVAMASRLNPAYPWWNPTFGQQDQAANLLYYSNFNQSEFIPALWANRYGTLAFPTTEACQGDSVLLYSGTAQGLVHAWYLNGMPIPNAANDSLYASQSGFYQAYTTDASCTYASDSIEVVVHALPQVNFGAPAQIWECYAEWPLSNANAAPAGGVWTGTALVNDTFVVSLAGQGLHVLDYAVTDSNGCVGDGQYVLEVLPDPQASLVFVTDEFCELEGAVDLSGLGSPANGFFSGTGMNGNLFDPTQAGPGSHLIQYELAIPFTNCYFLAEDTLTVLAAPPAPVISQSGNQLVSSQANTSWYLDDSPNPIFLGTGQTWPLIASGTYFATWTDANGCISPASNYQVVVVALEEGWGNGLALFPNPSAGALKVSGLAAGQYRVLIRDQMGRLQGEEFWEIGSGADGTLDVGALATGLYHLDLIHSGGGSQHGKFVKKN